MAKDTSKDISKIETLKQGKQSAFWKLIVDAIDESIEDIQRKQDSEEISELDPQQYKFRNELFKSKKIMLETLKKTPDNLASWYSKPETERQEFDPYDKN